MVTLLLDSARLEVVLSGSEKVLSGRKKPVRVPREQITKVQLTVDPWIWVRGQRASGRHVPGLLTMGTWRLGPVLDLVVLRRRRPGVVIDLEGAEFDRIILATRHGRELAKALRLDIADEPLDVADLVPRR